MKIPCCQQQQSFASGKEVILPSCTSIETAIPISSFREASPPPASTLLALLQKAGLLSAESADRDDNQIIVIPRMANGGMKISPQRILCQNIINRPWRKVYAILLGGLGGIILPILVFAVVAVLWPNPAASPNLLLETSQNHNTVTTEEIIMASSSQALLLAAIRLKYCIYYCQCIVFPLIYLGFLWTTSIIRISPTQTTRKQNQETTSIIKSTTTATMDDSSFDNNMANNEGSKQQTTPTTIEEDDDNDDDNDHALEDEAAIRSLLVELMFLEFGFLVGSSGLGFLASIHVHMISFGDAMVLLLRATLIYIVTSYLGLMVHDQYMKCSMTTDIASGSDTTTALIPCVTRQQQRGEMVIKSPRPSSKWIVLPRFLPFGPSIRHQGRHETLYKNDNAIDDPFDYIAIV